MCQYFGLKLVQDEPRWSVAAFMQRWQEDVPEVAACPIISRTDTEASVSQSTRPAVAQPKRSAVLSCGWRRQADYCCESMQDMSPDLSMLRGEVLVEAGQLHAFSAAALPKAPAQRFAALFAHRPIWPADDIPPYMLGLEVRSSVHDGIV